MSISNSRCMFLCKKLTWTQQSTVVQVSSILQWKSDGRSGNVMLIKSKHSEIKSKSKNFHID